MTAILDDSRVRHLRVDGRRAPVPPTGRPATLSGSGSVVALRQLRTVALGALGERAVLAGERLVIADDVEGHRWWIPAAAVWSDGHSERPEQPRPIGLAVASTMHAALLKGLSDRLGWEALGEFEQGRDLPVATAVGTSVANAVVLDGRLDHDVPTVIVLAAGTIRWGAASTWDGAMRRALYGDDAHVEPATELDGVCELLAGAGLQVASVDLGTPLLSAAALARRSVQLVMGNAAVRSWDADRVN